MTRQKKEERLSRPQSKGDEDQTAVNPPDKNAQPGAPLDEQTSARKNPASDNRSRLGKRWRS
ncbi:MAG: hypothetical protein M3285_08705 [Actinomycetota bacterium]|nr:hypothetical protein [Actinomycetota bacterium]